MASNPTSDKVSVGDTELSVYTWNAVPEPPLPALCVIFHGFLAHGRYPTVRYAADCLAAAGYTVVSCDFRGHGESPGTRGYLPSADVLIQDAAAVTNFARKRYAELNKVDSPKLFLVGSSMGGTIALSVAEQLEPDQIAGVVLLAPMLRLSVSAPVSSLLWCLSTAIPTWQVIPSSSTNAEKQYRDPAKRKECQDDELSISGSSIRVGSAYTCVSLASEIQAKFSSITVPLLIMVADEDVVVDNQGALDLKEQSPSKDKTLKHYPSLHGLLCEPSPLVDTIQDDVVAWVKDRTGSP